MKNSLARRLERAYLLDSFRPPEAKNVSFLLSRHDVRRVHEKFSSCRFERAHGCSTHFSLLSAKTIDSYFLDMMSVQFMKNFLLADSSMAVRLVSASWAPKTFDSFFLDMMCVEFMKNFLLADSSELMAVRLISASWAQKRLIPTFLTWCTSSSWKIFFLPIPSELMAVRLISASWAPKTSWFLLSRHDVRRVHEKFSSRRFERADGC